MTPVEHARRALALYLDDGSSDWAVLRDIVAAQVALAVHQERERLVAIVQQRVVHRQVQLEHLSPAVESGPLKASTIVGIKLGEALAVLDEITREGE